MYCNTYIHDKKIADNRCLELQERTTQEWDGSFLFFQMGNYFIMKTGFDNADIFNLELILEQIRDNKNLIDPKHLTFGQAIEKIEAIAYPDSHGNKKINDEK